MRVIFATILLLIAFQASARGGGGGHPSTESKGFYWVPVTPDLIQFSAFSVANVEIKTFGSDVKIEYTLPLELTGAPNQIEFFGARPQSGEMILTSNQGTMTCPEASRLSNCRVSYKNLVFDRIARDQILNSLAKTPEEMALRQAVAQLFESGRAPQCPAAPKFRLFDFSDGGEPHGFLSVIE